MNRTQLAVNFQIVCATELTSWKKYRKYALYRCTDDFVQWLNFDHSDFDVKIRPSYSIQALATQFPTIDLTLGNDVCDKQGLTLWIRPDDWRTHKDEFVKQIVQQIDPPALEPFTTKAILDFLGRFQSEHESVITARGIAAILAGNIDEGYHHFYQALDKYKITSQPWARVEESRLNGWLSCAPEDILSVLRQQAEIGAKLLRLK